MRSCKKNPTRKVNLTLYMHFFLGELVGLVEIVVSCEIGVFLLEIGLTSMAQNYPIGVHVGSVRSVDC